MREIKFRAWDEADKAMYYDIIYGIEFDDDSCYEFSNFVGGRLPSAVHRWSTIQYTGLKELSDKEIYDGDIIRITHRLLEIDPITRMTPEISDDVLPVK